MSKVSAWLSKVLFGLCLPVSLIALPTRLQAQFNTPPPPEAITDRQGLPQAFVPAIVQDKQGFIWMATLDGLARYDGRHFKVFQPTNDGRSGLSSAGIENLLTDPRGNLWIKTYHGDLDWFDPGRKPLLISPVSPFTRNTLAAIRWNRTTPTARIGCGCGCEIRAWFALN